KRCRMTETPEGADQRRTAQALMIAYDRRDRDEVVRVQRVSQPEDESPDQCRDYRRIHICSRLGSSAWKKKGRAANDTMTEASALSAMWDQVVEIGNGMKHNRKTSSAAIARAILAFPSGSSSIT